MAERWTPPLRLHVIAGRCHLWLGGIACGEGDSLQVAADRLIVSLRAMVLDLRRSGRPLSLDLARAEPRLVPFLSELGDLAARGEDIRARVLEPPAM
jgi:hypothetical protein